MRVLAWKWRHPDATVSIQALCERTAIACAEGSDMTQQVGFATEAEALDYLNSETERREERRYELVTEPRAFDLRANAAAELLVGVGSKFRLTPTLAAQLREEMRATGGTLLDHIASTPGVTIATSTPRDPAAGSLVFDATAARLRVFDGTEWIEVGHIPEKGFSIEFSGHRGGLLGSRSHSMWMDEACE